MDQNENPYDKSVIVRLCPQCRTNYFTPYGEEYVDKVSPPYPALSRLDNITYICSDCGMREALKEMRRGQ